MADLFDSLEVGNKNQKQSKKPNNSIEKDSSSENEEEEKKTKPVIKQAEDRKWNSIEKSDSEDDEGEHEQMEVDSEDGGMIATSSK